ncbi:MAG: hypothetical protein PHG84_02775 [Endomicrobiaceae bacterium]|nr:hypothetical protein [Endomicrobiaceae bacterium]
MDFAIETKLYNDNVFKEKINRIYFADAFCQNLIPTKQELEKAYKSAKDNNLQFTLNTPYVTDKGIKQILENIESIYKNEENFEVVFNDWGVFYEVKKRFPKVKLILGRLLTKQRTDPNAYEIITNSQKRNTDNNVIPKTVPDTLYQHFQSSVINDDVFQNYLISNSVNRVEIEYLVWDMNIKLTDKIKATIYYPYAHITTTRNCGLLNMTYTTCNKMCNDIQIQYKNESMLFPYIVIGNTVYYQVNDISKLQQYPSIDRIVFNDLEAYHKYQTILENLNES